MNKIKVHTRTKARGASGLTKVSFDPQTTRSISLDITNCPQCGNGHASAPLMFTHHGVAFGCPVVGNKAIYLGFNIVVSTDPLAEKNRS